MARPRAAGARAGRARMRRARVPAAAARVAASRHRRPRAGRYTTAVRAADIGERFGEADLADYARHLQGRALLELGRVDEGLALLDEAMVAVVAGELSPLVTGLIYCSVIEGCHQIYELRRAHEWTAALTRWCEAQPDLVTYTGSCLVHRAEILLLRGSWPDAIDEARRATERADQGADRGAAAAAFYLQGEGSPPAGQVRGGGRRLPTGEPGRGRTATRTRPAAPVRKDGPPPRRRRSVGCWARPRPRGAREAPLGGDRDPACRWVTATGRAKPAASSRRSPTSSHARMLTAMAAHARGAVELAGGDPQAALEALRRAERAWQELEAPYEVARVRV